MRSAMSNKNRLVVIGNGMAGARLIEDVIARGGADEFDFIVFGDEPYGNYNRILLSSVLAGTHEPHDIFINSLAWYEQNNVRLHAGVRVTSIDRAAKIVKGASGVTDSYDKLVIATGTSPFIPPLQGLRADCGWQNEACEVSTRQHVNPQSAIRIMQFKDGVYVFRTRDDCNGIST